MAEHKISDIPDDELLTLSLDNGQELRCQILTIMEVKKQDYIVLLPLDESYQKDGECFIYRYFEDNDDFHLENIIDDDEFEHVSDAFDEFLDACEYDELVEDNESPSK